jgi:hypothetical protein
MNLRDALLAAINAPPVPVQVEGFEQPVYIRPLSYREVVQQQDDTKDDKDRIALARGFCRVVVNADGTRCFDPDNKADVQSAADLPWPLMQAVLAASARQNGLIPADEKKA